MKFLILLCIIGTVFGSLEEDREQWLNFKNKHGKSYKNIEEEKGRFSIFQKNLRDIEEHNKKYEAGEETYFKGVNQFTDLTMEEFVAFLKRGSGEFQEPQTYSIHEEPIGIQAPSSIDWREKGAVSGVKDQGGCGSCWTFSVTGTLEGFYYLKHKKMITFSEQQLVDCNSENGGCNGGWQHLALEYVKNNGIESEDSYRYEGSDQTCRYNQNLVVTSIQGYTRIATKDENGLKSAVGSKGPTSVSIDATRLYSYAGGVYTDSECLTDFGQLNHAVLVVGYGKDSATGMDYWLIKNSWSTNWGDSGYFKLRRGTNECGVSSYAMYPTL